MIVGSRIGNLKGISVYKTVVKDYLQFEAFTDTKLFFFY